MKLKIVLISFLFLFLFGCSRGPLENRVETVFELQSDRIKIDSHSKFLKHLEIISLDSSESRTIAYESIGKMIALSNPSNDLTGPRTQWIELDLETLREAQLILQAEPEGSAYGMTLIPSDFAVQIRRNQPVYVRRYLGLDEGWSASVVKLIPTQDPLFVNVVFRLPIAHDLYPGTNCQVKFPLLQARATRVPSTAVLHDGVDEYVWQEIAPGEFVPHKVALAEGTSDEVILSSGISSQYKIIGRGAILLKPQLRPFLMQKEESKNALQNNIRRTQ